MLSFVRRLPGWVLAAVLCVGTAQADDLLLGQVGPFTVIPVPDAPEVNQGIQAAVNQLNKAGGIKNRKLAQFSLDDRYSADGFVEQFNKALERKPVALLSPIGSAALKRMLDDKLLDNAPIVVINAIPGAESFRNPGHDKLLHVRAGDRQQIEKMVQHARTIGMTKVAVLYQDLPIGTSGAAMAEEAAKAAGGITLQGVQSTAEPAALAAAAATIAKTSPHGVLVLGAPRFSADGVAALRKAGVAQSLFVLSYVPPGLLVKQAGIEGARGVGIAQVFPNPNGKVIPLVRDFQAAMQASFPDVKDYSTFQLEGYLATRVAAEGLKRAAQPTPAGLLAALRGMGELDLGGYRVDFSKGNAGSRFVDIAVVGADGKLRY